MDQKFKQKECIDKFIETFTNSISAGDYKTLNIGIRLFDKVDGIAKRCEYFFWHEKSSPFYIRYACNNMDMFKYLNEKGFLFDISVIVDAAQHGNDKLIKFILINTFCDMETRIMYIKEAADKAELFSFFTLSEELRKYASKLDLEYFFLQAEKLTQ